MQNAFRGYLFTNDITFPDLYSEGMKSVPKEPNFNLFTTNIKLI